MPLRIFGQPSEFALPSSFGDATFESPNGFLVFENDARGWMDYNFGIGAVRRGQQAPDLINLGATNIEVLGFDGVNTVESVDASIEMNHNWAEATTLYPHIHWLPSTAAAGNVNWQLEYVLLQDGGVVGASTTINVIQSTAEVAWTQQFANFPTISTVGFTIGAQLFFRLFRDPTDNDTYGADAALATFGIHVLIDTIGSRQIGTK
jgi:hypothetical protein